MLAKSNTMLAKEEINPLQKSVNFDSVNNTNEPDIRKSNILNKLSANKNPQNALDEDNPFFDGKKSLNNSLLYDEYVESPSNQKKGKSVSEKFRYSLPDTMFQKRELVIQKNKPDASQDNGSIGNYFSHNKNNMNKILINVIVLFINRKKPKAY